MTNNQLNRKLPRQFHQALLNARRTSSCKAKLTSRKKPESNDGYDEDDSDVDTQKSSGQPNKEKGRKTRMEKNLIQQSKNASSKRM